MPILKHAKKKLKQDKKRTIKNKKIKDTYKSFVKKAKEAKSKDSLSKAFSAVDKAAKKNILSENKAARLKSSLTKHVSGEKTIAHAKAAPKKTVKPAVKASKSTGAKTKKPSSKK
jgi:small subunit ribosomal protein S20